MMANRNKTAGDQAEKALVDWLRANGWPDACRARGEAVDFGDIGGIPGTAVQVKRAKRTEYVMPRLRAAQEGALVQAQGRRPVAVVRLPGVTDPARWWAATPHRRGISWPPIRPSASLLPLVGARRVDLAEAVDVAGWAVRGDWLVSEVGRLFPALREET